VHDDVIDAVDWAVEQGYADPDGARGEIALLRLPARGERTGSLLVNPGGPGSSGMSFVAMQASEVLGQPMTKEPVGDRFDVVGFDPRGVGASTPRADCYTDAEYDRGEASERTRARRATGPGGGSALHGGLRRSAAADRSRHQQRRTGQQARAAPTPPTRHRSKLPRHIAAHTFR